MAVANHSCYLWNRELFESRLDTLLEREEPLVPHSVQSLTLEVILHNGETTFNGIVLRGVRHVPDHCDL